MSPQFHLDQVGFVLLNNITAACTKAEISNKTFKTSKNYTLHEKRPCNNVTLLQEILLFILFYFERDDISGEMGPITGYAPNMSVFY